MLIRAKLVTEDDVTRALERLQRYGGRLGDNLVALGVIDHKTLEAFLHRIPVEPADIAATGIEENDLLSLLIKLIYENRLVSVRQFVDAIKLPYHIVMDLVKMAVDRQLLHALGTRYSDSMIDMSYAFTEEGRHYAQDALQRSRYVGPAPVTLDEFTDKVNLQKLTNELISMERIRESVGELVFDDSILEQSGPALNSGRAMLLYGPPGNGKTSVAHSFSSVYNDVIYVPYSFIVEGQIIRMYDPSIHSELSAANLTEDDTLSVVRREEFDQRWVPCRRPFVVTGGELTLEMLDLRYDASGHYYEAPLHVKALGGCMIIDDFGRQLVSPTHLLNRWIVPLEGRVDFLKLHTGKSFSIPFEELVIFSTNLEPEDLMDPAFLRRLPYKIAVDAPSLENFREIFNKECARHALQLPDESFQYIVKKITEDKGLELAAFQPKFIVDQVVATCRFLGVQPRFEPRFVDYALDNLRVKRTSAKGNGANTPASTPSVSTEPPSTAPEETDSASAPSVRSEPPSAESASFEWASTESASAEPPSAESASAEWASTVPASTESEKTAPSSTAWASAESASTESSSTESVSTESVSTEPPSAESASTESPSTEWASTALASAESVSTESVSTAE